MDIEILRENYGKSISNNELCRTLIEDLKSKKSNSIYLAYLGGLQAIWANHTINPISKLQTFNKGKNNLEKAVKMMPDDIEIRFIRLSVQRNAPRFLGYYPQIKEDEEFIRKHQQFISEVSLLQLIKSYK